MTSTGETSGIYTKYSQTFTVSVDPAASNLCLDVRLRWNGATAEGDAWLIAGPQLEPGSECTPLEIRPMATELALCQRYYIKLGIRGRCVNMNGSSFAALNVGYVPNSMRANPSLVSSDTILINKRSNGSANTSVDITSVANLQTSGYIRLNGQTSTGNTTSDIFQVQTEAIRLSAEL
jgi:hypothetical protein